MTLAAFRLFEFCSERLSLAVGNFRAAEPCSGQFPCEWACGEVVTSCLHLFRPIPPAYVTAPLD